MCITTKFSRKDFRDVFKYKPYFCKLSPTLAFIKTKSFTNFIKKSFQTAVQINDSNVICVRKKVKKTSPPIFIFYVFFFHNILYTNIFS